jgi:hypothetical protein
MSDFMAEPRCADALRSARRGLIVVRFLCAITFSAAGFFASGMEAAYQAFAPLYRAIDQDQFEASEHPDRPESQIRAAVAFGYRPRVQRASDFANNCCLWAAGVLTVAGILGMAIGYRLGAVIRLLDVRPPAKAVPATFDPEFDRPA